MFCAYVLATLEYTCVFWALVFFPCHHLKQRGTPKNTSDSYFFPVHLIIFKSVISSIHPISRSCHVFGSFFELTCCSSAVVKNHPICTQRHIGALFFSFFWGSSRVLDMLRIETYHQRCPPRTEDTCARYLNPINRYKQSLQSI